MSWRSAINRNLGPWDFVKRPSNYSYNDGDKIATSADPTWDMVSGTRVSQTHIPCGYWFSEPHTVGPNPPPPPLSGDLYSAGRNSGGELLRNYPTDQYTFGLVDPAYKFIDFSLGSSNATFVTEDGTLWCIGSMFAGSTLTQYLTDCIKCSCSATSSAYAIKSDGSLWSMGVNGNGELGLNDTLTRTSFVMADPGPFKEVSSGYYCCFAIKEDGSLWACGNNVNSNLGFGDSVERHIFTHVHDGPWKSISQSNSNPFALAISDSGLLFGCGYNIYGMLCLDNTTATTVFTARPSGGTWLAAKAGYTHSAVLKSDGTLWTVGLGTVGQLGMGDFLTNTALRQVGSSTSWLSIGAGTNYTMAANSSGDVWATGTDLYGRLGIDGDGSNVNVLTQCVGISGASMLNCGVSASYALKTR